MIGIKLSEFLKNDCIHVSNSKIELIKTDLFEPKILVEIKLEARPVETRLVSS